MSGSSVVRRSKTDGRGGGRIRRQFLWGLTAVVAALSPLALFGDETPSKSTLRVVCDREKLLDAFRTAAAAAPSRSEKWALRSVKFEALDGSATHGIVMATDLDVGIRVDVPGIQVESPGSVVLPIARFASILQELDTEIRLESDDQGTIVRSDRSEFRLPAANPGEFPAIAEFTGSDYYELPGPLFREIVRRTVFATGAQTSRYALGGVLVELASDKFSAVGTDGHRLAIMEAPAKAVGEHPTAANAVKTAIIPTRAMLLIERLLLDDENDVQLAIRAKDVLIKTARGSIHARPLDGRFPKWRDLIPTGPGLTKIELVAGPTHAAVRQAAIVTDEQSRGLDFTFGNGKLVLAGGSAEIGQSRIEIPVRGEHKPTTITLDPRYMSDFLKALPPEKTFTMAVKDAVSAILCGTDDGYRYIIMPIARERQ